MKNSLPINPYIHANSPLAEIETELEDLLTYAENVMDWQLSRYEEEYLTKLTKLAKARGSKRKW